MTGTGRIKSVFRPHAGRARQQNWPGDSRAFDLAALFFAALPILGAAVDSNAHNHGRVDDTFFTPWHLLLYSGLASCALFLLAMQYRNVARGYRMLRALPRGYLLSLAGTLLFGLAGVLDLFWHEAFGFELDLEAMLSPTHLLLGVGAFFFCCGPLRAAWGRAKPQSGWAQLFPALGSALLMLMTCSLFTEFANVMFHPDLFVELPVGNTGSLDMVLISSVMFPAALYSGFLFLLLKRWQLPFGAVTFLLLGNSLLVFYLRLDWVGEHWPVLCAALIAGLAGDGLLLRSQPLTVRKLRILAFIVPFLYFLAFFAILMLTASIWWAIHLWLGSSVMAGLIGLGMSYLHTPPALPAELPE